MIVSILYKVIRNRSSDVKRLDATLGLFVKNLKGVKVQDVSHLNYSLNLKNKLSYRVKISWRGGGILLNMLSSLEFVLHFGFTYNGCALVPQTNQPSCYSPYSPKDTSVSLYNPWNGLSFSQICPYRRSQLDTIFWSNKKTKHNFVIVVVLFRVSFSLFRLTSHFPAQRRIGFALSTKCSVYSTVALSRQRERGRLQVQFGEMKTVCACCCMSLEPLKPPIGLKNGSK